MTNSEAIETLKANYPDPCFGLLREAVDAAIYALSAQTEEITLHESCTDCPLYDKNRHSCPRFNKVIPETLREVMAERRQDD